MSIVSLIAKLAEKDIRLWLENDQLRYSAPEGAMTPDVIAELRANKADIMSFLAQSSEQGESIDKLDYQPGDKLTVSAAQQRLWFLQQLEPDNAAYHIHAALEIKGELDATRLSQACAQVAERHEILRTAYIADGGNVKQTIVDFHNRPIEVIETTQANLDNAIDTEHCRPFNLETGDVFRVVLFKLADNHHVFCFTIHHIAADGWSLGIFVNELIACYESINAGIEAPLLPLERQYADYAAWQQSDAHQKQQAEQLDYWKETLAGAPNLALPLNHSRAPDAGNQARFIDITLNAEELSSLKNLAKSQDATLFMALTCAYAALLKRYCQQNDFCIGTPIAGRNAQQLEPLIGCFLNVLALRFELDDEQSFNDALTMAKQVCTDAFANQDVAFEQIVNALSIERDLAVTPLFQTMVSLQSAEFAQAKDVSNLAITPIQQTHAEAQFDLKLTANEVDDGLTLRFEYKTALFEAERIQQMADHFRVLIKAVCTNPNQPIEQIALLNPSERDQALALNDWNNTATPLPDNRLIHQAIEAQAEKTPNQLAISGDDAQYSYLELNQAANRLAHYLTAQGVTPGSAIGIALKRSCNMSIALLAILKAGCAYVPMDPDFPEDRLAFMADELTREADLKLILTDSQCQTALSATPTQKILIDTLETGEFSAENLSIPQANNSLFNIIYTSGSTGTPKGVMVPHEGIFNRLSWMQKQYPLTGDDRILQKTPYSFDVSVWEFFWPLMTGASCHFAAPDEHKDPKAIAQRIQQQGITTCHFVPSMLGAFLAESSAAECTSLKQVFCSGEALQLEHESGFLNALPQAALHNLYGPTEASVDVSYYACTTDNDRASVPIGKPIDNIQLHILDKNRNPMPKGLAGELYIGGIGLALGYLARPEQTAASFIENPFAANGHPSPRLYRSGDLVRLDDDGNLIYLGRIDHQVKIRGNRIELGEIEHALVQQTGVEEAVVCAKGQGANSQLIAYLIGDNGLDTDAIAQQLASQLPAYMQPAAIMQLQSWPLSPNGKINRNKLPEPDWQALNQTPYVAPSTPTEITLAAIWSEVLGIEQVGINDSFFALGGHSLTATQAIAKAQETFGIEIPLRDIFKTPTIAGIASIIDNAVIESSVFADGEDAEDDDLESFVL